MNLKAVLGSLKSAKTPQRMKDGLVRKFGTIAEIEAKIAKGITKTNPQVSFDGSTEKFRTKKAAVKFAGMMEKEGYKAAVGNPIMLKKEILAYNLKDPVIRKDIRNVAGKLLAEGLTSSNYTKAKAKLATKNVVMERYVHSLIDNYSDIIKQDMKSMESSNPADHRPPKEFWKSCTKKVAKKGGVDPEKVCGATWRKASPHAKAEAIRRSEKRYKANTPLEVYPFLTSPKVKDILRRGQDASNVHVIYKADGKLFEVGFKDMKDAAAFNDRATRAGWKQSALRGVKAGLSSKKKVNSNPAGGGVEIYDTLLEIRAEKGAKSNWPKELFRHSFSPKSKAKIYGMPDGSLMIKSAKGKRLWKEFTYPDGTK